jgi:hypothetical protein
LKYHYVPHLLLRPNWLLAMTHPEVEIPALVAKLVEYGVNFNAWAESSIRVPETYHYCRRQPINMIMDAWNLGDYPREELQRVHLILLRALVEHGAFDPDFILNPNGTREDAYQLEPRLRVSLETAGMRSWSPTCEVRITIDDAQFMTPISMYFGPALMIAKHFKRSTSAP